MDELVEPGDPSFRPQVRYFSVTRTAGMVSSETRLRSCMLIGTVTESQRQRPLSATDLLIGLQTRHNIQRDELRVEVCPPPANYFVTFTSASRCSSVLETSSCLQCNGATIEFSRWYPEYGAYSSDFAFFAKLSFDGLPAYAREEDAINQILNKLRGCLIQIQPTSNHCNVQVYAWLHNPNEIPRQMFIEIPQASILNRIPIGHNNVPLLDVVVSAPAQRTLIYPVIAHVHEVICREPVQRHTFNCWIGRLDGTGPADTVSGGQNLTTRSAGGDEQNGN